MNKLQKINIGHVHTNRDLKNIEYIFNDFVHSEIWVNYNDIHSVSNLGRVKRVDSKNTTIVKQHFDKDGYLYVTLKNNKKEKVHRLVAKCFIPNIKNKKTVNHIDECKTNNTWLNLNWLGADEQNKYSRGINVIFFHDGSVVSYPSINEAYIDLNLDPLTIKNKVKEFDLFYSCIEKILKQDFINIKKEDKLLSTNTSGYSGIKKSKGKWVAVINYNGKRHHIGDFKDIEAAVLGRDKFIIKNSLPFKLNILKEDKVFDKEGFIKTWSIFKESINNETDLKVIKNILKTVDKYISEIHDGEYTNN